MTEEQRRRFNDCIRNHWERGKEMLDKYIKETDPTARERYYRKSDEAFGWANGMREAALILGYVIGYTKDDVPCIEENEWIS